MTRIQLIKKLNSQRSHLNDSELIKMLRGIKISYGSSRQVYQCKMHPDFVVKIQYNEGFDNVIENEIWSAICMADWWNKWFAECAFISRSGKILVQEKIDVTLPKSLYPKQIPRFFTDIKIENYGFVGDQLKCCDYANVLGMLTGFMDKKMRRAKW